MATDPIEQLRSAMAAKGISFLGPIHMDGQRHRIKAEGDRQANSWYTGHLDGIPGGAFGCWKRGINARWRGKSNLTPAELQTAYERGRRQRQEADAKRRLAEEMAATKAQQLWNAAYLVDGNSHAYLERKGIGCHGCRMLKGNLIIPRFDTDGGIQSLQFIAADGTKRYLRGGRTFGTYFPIGNITDRLYLVEGYATGASILEATGHAVAVTFSTATLSSAAQALRMKFPNLQFIFAADHDDAGLKASHSAAKLTNGLVIYPPIDGQDFNDMHQSNGLDAVREALAWSSKHTT